ncbi:hypothetical protein A2631_01790 [Candidatus Daviesbacteria bacterium RIFCSPHIGHO2_01_FULL_44_29]|uniref:Uncharacterized protein n=1 Tax=Candidatus Daviesbacteria bacterium RIFCSPHIGHO2_02_FULL_43_12 TaxID=1797776 RepID=A0A1F5KJQ8_9BACT|nr:MAG: hypothetical protein A2631_01790 [Candidatus Daviesbacteria bacterium RIFCSPHIGHO2_01_FULL_44_29]OGE39024.1 MAG: hypothetical protein A3E86_00290 [Candidatus Daviesbacteria bacterium RIFCSPHIGHO2_12_FULL_47_45]OGE41132.1 MAG: hypothetical protein A3D25_01185 [Candidatus Daviesbacteria bacterium RIFCSPHIGHO2_02_FULL_43_12]OGE69331.1 MAG: hypothetical protein A3B55_02925 [Candidatus Daviesbacteria bacterium RIFCSPLOWO2_01_FULL_43_15]
MLDSIASTILFGFLQLGKPSFEVRPTVLSSHQMSLDNRYPVESVNEVFKDNILLTLNYMNNSVPTKSESADKGLIDWEKVKTSGQYELTLAPNETFAFHDNLLPQFVGKVSKTTNAHFNGSEKFKSDGYLMGDGVCHLASILKWAAADAGLDVLAPTRHDFANIPEVPRDQGVSIYSMPGQGGNSALQNLYITNNKDKTIRFIFDYKDSVLTVSTVELS